MVHSTNSSPSRLKEGEMSEDNEVIGAPTSGRNTPNGILKRKSEEGEGSKKRKKKKALKANGQSHSRRRPSISKPARDSRDDPTPPTPATETRSPSPVIDFDGLSRPSK